jgi:hypothetical protein
VIPKPRFRSALRVTPVRSPKALKKPVSVRKRIRASAHVRAREVRARRIYSHRTVRVGAVAGWRVAITTIWSDKRSFKIDPGPGRVRFEAAEAAQAGEAGSGDGLWEAFAREAREGTPFGPGFEREGKPRSNRGRKRKPGLYRDRMMQRT